MPVDPFKYGLIADWQQQDYGLQETMQEKFYVHLQIFHVQIEQA